MEVSEIVTLSSWSWLVTDVCWQMCFIRYHLALYYLSGAWKEILNHHKTESPHQIVGHVSGFPWVSNGHA